MVRVPAIAGQRQKCGITNLVMWDNWIPSVWSCSLAKGTSISGGVPSAFSAQWFMLYFSLQAGQVLLFWPPWRSSCQVSVNFWFTEFLFLSLSAPANMKTSFSPISSFPPKCTCLSDLLFSHCLHFINSPSFSFNKCLLCQAVGRLWRWTRHNSCPQVHSLVGT